MRVELEKLLKEQQIYHPTRLVGISAADGELRLTIKGYVWWKEEADDNEEGSITFIFVWPNSGALHADIFSNCGDDEADEVLEDFSIDKSEPGSLSDHEYLSLYASSPIPDPLSLYLKVDDYLSGLYTFRRPNDFLNCGAGGLVGFTKIAQSSAFLIARAPGALCDIIVHELEAQGVKYYHSDPVTLRKNGLIISWYGMAFECEAAYAEFD